MFDFNFPTAPDSVTRGGCQQYSSRLVVAPHCATFTGIHRSNSAVVILDQHRIHQQPPTCRRSTRCIAGDRMPAAPDTNARDAAVTRTGSARNSIIYGVGVLLAFVGLFVGLLWYMPQLSALEKSVLLKTFPPKSIEAIRDVRDVLIGYSATNPVLTAVALCFMYIFMQTFAIPGTLSLSMLSGAFFGLKIGFPLVSIISTLGSTSCYLLSWCLGKPLVYAIWPDKVERFRREVSRRRKDMLSYMLFLRVTPVLPNTFINVASPIVGVPLHVFALGTFLGCVPNSFVAVNAGVRLSELNSLKDLVDVKLIALGVFVGVIALVPVFLSNQSSSAEATLQPHDD